MYMCDQGAQLHYLDLHALYAAPAIALSCQVPAGFCQWVTTMFTIKSYDSDSDSGRRSGGCPPPPGPPRSTWLCRLELAIGSGRRLTQSAAPSLRVRVIG